MREERIERAFEELGFWWLPSAPDQEVPGVLKFEPGVGGTLDLFDTFRPMEGAIGATAPIELLQGVTSDGTPTTLVGCLETHTAMTFGRGFSTATLSIDRILRGGHWATPDEVRLTRLAVRYSYLDEWVGVSGLSRTLDLDGHRTSVHFELPDPIILFTGDDVELSIEFRASIPGLWARGTAATISQRAYIVASARPRPMLIDELLGHVRQIRRLASFGLMRPMHASEMDGLMLFDGQEPSRPHPVTILERTELPDGPSKSLIAQDMLFAMRDFRGRETDVVRAWMRNVDEVTPTYDLYAATLYDPTMYLQHRFLSLVQAVETYHRRRMDRPDVLPDVHQARMTRIVAALEPPDREWLGRKLQHSNELTLAVRLRDIVETTFPLNEYFRGREAAFSRKVVDTRNYLTHYSEELRGRAVTGAELFKTTEELRLILDTRFLHDLGVGDEEVRRLINRNRVNNWRFGRV